MGKHRKWPDEFEGEFVTFTRRLIVLWDKASNFGSISTRKPFLRLHRKARVRSFQIWAKIRAYLCQSGFPMVWWCQLSTSDSAILPATGQPICRLLFLQRSPSFVTLVGKVTSTKVRLGGRIVQDVRIYP